MSDRVFVVYTVIVVLSGMAAFVSMCVTGHTEYNYTLYHNAGYPASNILRQFNKEKKITYILGAVFLLLLISRVVVWVSYGR